jgi:hypothetical protein
MVIPLEEPAQWGEAGNMYFDINNSRLNICVSWWQSGCTRVGVLLQ